MEIESDERTTASTRAPTPYSAIRRAWVEENKEIIKTRRIGLINQPGNELAPPGLPSKAINGPPPEINNPGSTRSRLGCTKTSSENGMFIKNGVKINAARF